MLTEQNYPSVTHDNLHDEGNPPLDAANLLIKGCNYLFIEKML